VIGRAVLSGTVAEGGVDHGALDNRHPDTNKQITTDPRTSPQARVSTVLIRKRRSRIWRSTETSFSYDKYARTRDGPGDVPGLAGQKAISATLAILLAWAWLRLTKLKLGQDEDVAAPN
jgi:hypothetical protein